MRSVSGGGRKRPGKKLKEDRDGIGEEKTTLKSGSAGHQLSASESPHRVRPTHIEKIKRGGKRKNGNQTPKHEGRVEIKKKRTIYK